MHAIRNIGEATQLRHCMPQQGWTLKPMLLVRYAEKWLGREAEGMQPMAAYFGGKLDPYQMLYSGQMMTHTPATRAQMLPDRRPCAPFKDPRCWTRKHWLVLRTCDHCCFDQVFTYERCCNTDFKDLVCELERKGEEGGCVDCKKTVKYVCLTPTEKRLADAQK